jgi:hypothetical protein
MKTTCLTLLALASLVSTSASAQVRFPGEPALGGADLADVPYELVPGIDVPALLAEDAVRAPWPLRYGVQVPLTVDVATHGQWSETPDGTLVWRVGIAAPGAYSIGLEFSEFRLPEDARLFLYDERQENVYGAYGHRNESPDGEFVIEPFPGASGILELQLPGGFGPDVRLAVDHVIHDYKNVFDVEDQLDAVEALDGEGADSGDGACTLNVNCPAGDPYPLLKRATVRTLSGGGLCSGVLLNNTAEDGARYLLTAHHCGQSNNTTVRFNYQTANCGGGGAPTNQNVSGVTLLATHALSDNRLFRINNNIPSGYNAYFAGWSRQTANLTFGMSMHHPSGGPKCISIDSNGGGKLTINLEGTLVRSWAMDFQTGGTEGGSSGGPLFDNNDRVRGVLSGGPNFDCFESYYGRFYEFWNANPIAQWLDPLGTNTLTLDGFDPSDPGGGGGPTAPNITAVTPGFLSAVVPDGASITLTGTGFTGTTQVSIDGEVLPILPPTWNVIDDTTMTINVPIQDKLGAVPIAVTNALGTGTANLSIAANLVPALELVNSDPGFLLTAAGAQIYVGSLPGDVVFLQASGSNAPSVLPGIVSLDIGNNFSDLVDLGVTTVNPATGYSFVDLPLPGDIPTGTQFFVQAGVLSALLPVLPVSTTNVQSCTVLF